MASRSSDPFPEPPAAAGVKRAAPDEDHHSSQDAPAHARSSVEEDNAHAYARSLNRTGARARARARIQSKAPEHLRRVQGQPPKVQVSAVLSPIPRPQASALPPPTPSPVRAGASVAAGPPATAAADPTNPFRALDTSEALQMLFRKYPGLPAQLMEIHAATLPPKEAPDKVIPASLMQGVARKRDGWNHDVGIRNGKAALRRAKKDTGEAGEAIREYIELILHVMGEAGHKGDAPSFIQQQAAREDTKLIQQLMAEEQRKR
ncbi:hypothetical protein ESCO_001911 [Escovopsis weberi]|uniref:Uncharacterized protein n=1 Tax=Escovopsis weberi TaxID=150374 RepID=A0A0M8N3S6_ESCWE|nr:hypothetical protein ESCO_001911 [Escovopsis weberi]